MMRPQDLDRERIDFAFGMTAGAEAAKSPTTPVIDERLADDAAGRVAGAEKQDVVRFSHTTSPRVCVAAGSSQPTRIVAANAPTNCAKTNQGTSVGRMPA